MRFHSTVLISSCLFLIVIFINYSIGTNLGDLGVLFPFPVMPPGITFGISWSLIYIGLTIAVVSRRSKRIQWVEERDILNKLFWVSCILNVVWILLTFMQEYILGVGVLFGLAYILYTMIRMMIVKQNKLHLTNTTLIPFSFYLGRMLIASSVLGISQIAHIGRGISVTGTLRRSLLIVSIGIALTFYVIRNTTRKVGILPLRALITIGIENYMIGNSLIALGCIVGVIVLSFGIKNSLTIS